MILNGTGGAYTDNILHTVAVIQLVRINTDGRHTHTGGHYRDFNALVSAGVTVDTADIVHKDGIFQEILCDKLGAKGITGHQNGLAEITGFCADMGSGGIEHNKVPPKISAGWKFPPTLLNV